MNAIINNLPFLQLTDYLEEFNMEKNYFKSFKHCASRLCEILDSSQ